MSGLKKLQRPPGYELFFAPLAVGFSPNDHERVQFAYFVSKYGHAKQVRDGGGRYYLINPKAAAQIYINELKGRDARIIVDLLLHDISEDAYLLVTVPDRFEFWGRHRPRRTRVDQTSKGKGIGRGISWRGVSSRTVGHSHQIMRSPP